MCLIHKAFTNTYLVPAYVPGTVLGSEDAEQTKAPALMEEAWVDG